MGSKTAGPTLRPPRNSAFGLFVQRMGSCMANGELYVSMSNIMLDVCFIYPLPVLQGCPWDRHAPAWLLEPGWSPALPGGGPGAGLTKWTSSLRQSTSSHNVRFSTCRHTYGKSGYGGHRPC